jgi:hypothetical protein
VKTAPWLVFPAGYLFITRWRDWTDIGHVPWTGRAIATRVAFAALEAAGANIDILANKAGQC